jgi:hypothetical protein
MAGDTETFEAVADALVKVRAADRVKTSILAATMDVVGVPMLSVNRYRQDAAIVALFASRGVTIVAPADEPVYVGCEADCSGCMCAALGQMAPCSHCEDNHVDPDAKAAR